MLRQLFLIALTLVIFGCKKDTTLAFTTAHYEEKTKRPCKDQCTGVTIDVPVAQNTPVVSDSINNKVFDIVKSIVYFGEKPTDAKSYEEITASFITAYDTLVEKFPNEGLVPWEAKVKGEVVYESGKLINIKINSYMFTGGAHGYEGDRSLLMNPEDGASLSPKDIFKDLTAFTAFAEKKFREKFKIPANKSINATGLMFAEDKFILPQNIFFQKDGLLLYYNSYEAASYADGAKELFIPYSEADSYLKMK